MGNMGEQQRLYRLKKARSSDHCPKCGGSLFHVDDTYGAYEQCLQCGFIKYPSVIRLTDIKEDLINSEV